ncbi:hypothetical protein LVJ83_05480 [Uruburuella testudinis]|uniref:C-type lysozyme inhibitor domain-containing protein n=1 Tax=Uruburuella testudinis TaxID=1282863 RepID=A0ABY4DVQ9_9NEIS|nr:hypothetical protein [Uruburuella testudinis]UOO82913.1 hypothetical protein LVJ83_05480 [Uruburuella testudinis]
MKPIALLLIFACTACGSQKAVRPEAPAPIVAATQTYTIDYRAAKGNSRIRAVYINSNSPLTVELHQGSTVETLTQASAWAQGAEYSNATTRWHVQDNAATLTRKGKQTQYLETD